MRMELVGSYATWQTLGGRPVRVEEVQAELSRLPMDGVLGFLGARSVEAIQVGQGFFDMSRQGHWLNLALVDDFPVELRNASGRYLAGRVPATGESKVLLHEQNVAWLAHHALLHGDEQAYTPEFSYELQRRICRLLLIVNDYFAPANHERPPWTLSEARDQVLNWLRHGQFNRFFEASPLTLLRLARQRVILGEILPRYFPELQAAFAEATGGMSLERHFEVLSALLTHFHHIETPGGQWMKIEPFVRNLKGGADDMRRIVHGMARSPAAYRAAWRQWVADRTPDTRLDGYDYVLLRQTPFIEITTGEFVCPVLPFLVSKIEDAPYFILSEHLKDPGQFQQALGYAFADYANGLVERLSQADRAGQWNAVPEPSTGGGEELADGYLQRSRVGIAFEYKGGRPGTGFLTGGEGYRVLGPAIGVLQDLAAGKPVELCEGKKQDGGILTRGMWQQSLAGSELARWAGSRFGVVPERMYPLIIHQLPFHVDPFSRTAYLDRLIASVRLYPKELWAAPQWLGVAELETLVAAAERGAVDLQRLLEEKDSKARTERFDAFLYKRLPGNFVEARLREEVLDLLRNTARALWGKELKNAELHADEMAAFNPGEGSA